jgi:Leucine-rich repeat (LRR) protein
MYPQWIRDNFEYYRFLLKKFCGYSDIKPYWDSSFSCANAAVNPVLQILKEKYRLDTLERNRNDLDTCLKAMEWTFCRLLYREKQEFTGPLNALEILEFSKSNRVTVNCLCHATVLTEVLLALGFKAKTISCLPIDLIPIDNHVITTVYISSLDRWIMLDPALCCYITDSKKTILSIPEIRRNLISDIPLEVCIHSRFQNAGLPDAGFSTFDKSEYIAYLHKNFFRFMSSRIPGPVHDDPVFYLLVPDGFLPPDTEQKNTQRDGVITVRITNNENFFWYNEAKEEGNDAL